MTTTTDVSGADMRAGEEELAERSASTGLSDSPATNGVVSTGSNAASRSTSADLVKSPVRLNSETFLGDSPKMELQAFTAPDDSGSNCPYCRKGFRKPRVLDCLHSMCEDCVIAQLDGREDPSKHCRNLHIETDSNDIRPTPPGVIKWVLHENKYSILHSHRDLTFRCPLCGQVCIW